MSKHKSVEPLSDHPLFRALVLMGGGLAVGCGGVAQRDSPDGLDLGTSGAPSGGAASIAGTSNVGGSGISVGSPIIGGATQSAAGARNDIEVKPAPAYNPSCPYAQWSCHLLAEPSTCSVNLRSATDPLAAGCTCDTSRPTSASACKADETFVCRQAYAGAAPNTWDGTLHVECACVPSPPPTGNCDATCVKAYGQSGEPLQCYLPARYTCDGQGVCSATSADVLRQDGIMCGCATIALK